MQPRRRRAESASGAHMPPKAEQRPIYSHVSTYRSAQLELQLYSPSLKVHDDGRGPIAVFGEHDHIGGKVLLDSSCYHSGRLTISVQGIFTYPTPTLWSDETDSNTRAQPTFRKNIFFTSSTTINVSPSLDSYYPRSAFREAFVRRRPSAPTMNMKQGYAERTYPFTFYLPQSSRPGEELPASFSTTKNAPSSSMSFEVDYKITAVWEPSTPESSSSILEIPIILQPDAGFQSVDATEVKPDAWLEMPLKADRPMPYRCAVTVPTSVTFSRASSVPYFVVFTTTPRSPSLAKEIAADSSISVSLLRQITIIEKPTPPLSPTHSSSCSDDNDKPRRNLLRRVRGNHPRISSRSQDPDRCPSPDEKPLPALPPYSSSVESQSLHTDICIGFPKRPRLHCETDSHPSLESYSSLPDGLYKSKISLNKEMLPCIDWAGINVKYYLDVSVMIGQEDLHARVPIRIL